MAGAVTEPSGAERRRALAVLHDEIVTCARCPRLVAWREATARTKRAAFSGEEYWGRALPGFGDADGRVLLVGLAPAAHGGNRTGRVFTGDRSGDWLFAALWRAGLANQPESRAIDDGLALRDAYVVAAVRCAPPANQPTTAERDACLPYLRRELSLLVNLRVVVALGGFAHDVVARGLDLRPRPRFRHGAEALSTAGIVVLDSYHPSQRNTSTGTLTAPMLDEVLQRARTLAAAPPTRGG
jgi:uracil-DNA glycosylase